MVRIASIAALIVAVALMRPLACSAQLSPSNGPTETKTDTAVTLVTEGTAVVGDDLAAANDEAIWDAKRAAVEQAVGVSVHSSTLGNNYAIQEDEIRSRCMGFVRAWNVVPASRRIETLAGEQVLHLKISASVAIIPAIHELADMKALYNELERPRIRVDIFGGDYSRALQEVLSGQLRSQGFDVAAEGPAEVVIAGSLVTVPTLRLGDADSPNGLALAVASCRAVLTLDVRSQVSEDLLISARVESSGQSFQSDQEAEQRASETAGQDLIRRRGGQFLDELVERWLRERQEGYVASLQIQGLSQHQCDLLQRAIEHMRGFRRVVEETRTPPGYKLRFITRLDGKTLRARLSALTLDSQRVFVDRHQGAAIVCSLAQHRDVEPEKDAP